MDGIDLMAAAMHAARTRLDVSASNLANASSAGFRRRIARAMLTERGLVVATALDRRQGPLERTGRTFDLAVVGGSLFVRDPRGAVVAERSASFSLDATGALVDERGRALLGERGLVRASSGATVDARGVVRDDGNVFDRIRLSSGASVESGFLERSNVDSIGEMVDVLAAQRAFETAEKTLAALDETRAKDANDVARVKS
jgi:flagellar basal-body rod protein FlgF